MRAGHFSWPRSAYFLARAASSAAALPTDDAFTGAPWALALASTAAQLASLARPGSANAKLAARGDNRLRPAPMAPWVMAGVASTPRLGDASLPLRVIGAFRRSS